MSTIFVALQCFQCSTMQVKQKKKSSNKWTCVVCNQKQSVRKVFAQGYMAKDLRKFVQSFNMSRKFTDEQDSLRLETPIPTSHSQTYVSIGFEEDQQRKRRTDWSEYLDPEEENKKEEDEGDDFGPQIVTELPKEMFKKPKLRNYACGSGIGHNGGDNNLYKPVFASRNTNKSVKSLDKESRKYQPTSTSGTSKWSDYVIQDDNEARRAQPTAVITKASKWNDYITQEDDNLNLGSGRNFANHMGQQSCNDWETILDDQKVEDDVHPDFM